MPIRVSIVGLGTVGRWVLRALDDHRARLAERYGVEFVVVALANRRDGFVHRERGIAPREALTLLERNVPIAELAGVEHWPGARDGLEATDTDVLVEVSQSPAADGEPGLAHIRAALERGIAVATSNKWPVALAGVELARLARDRGAAFRAEATVMSGTPVLGMLREGIAGAEPVRLRGVLNATVNYICSRLAEGAEYGDALAEAQRAGLAEPDPAEDVDGLDSVAKLMILSALVFSRQLEIADVVRHGISAVPGDEIVSARRQGRPLREVSTLGPSGDRHSVAIETVEPGDPLFELPGRENLIVAEVEPIGEVAIRGPGAGVDLAGQGVLSDLIACASS